MTPKKPDVEGIRIHNIKNLTISRKRNVKEPILTCKEMSQGGGGFFVNFLFPLLERTNTNPSSSIL